MSTATRRRRKTTSQRCKHELPEMWCSLCNEAISVETSTYRWEMEHPGDDVKQLAAGFVEQLTENELRRMCSELLEDRFADHRRKRARDLEQRASAAEQAMRRAAKKDQRNKSAEKYRETKPWNAPADTGVGREWRRLSDDERAVKRAEKDEMYGRFLREVEDGEYDERSYIAWQMKVAISDFVECTRQQVFLELTSELLGSKFSLGDGTNVTWGEATAEQHGKRFQLLLSQASGTVESAHRHQAAVALLRRHKVSTLNEVTAMAA